jgi:hypothetical protein
MAKRVFELNLSVKSIEQLKKDLLNYKNELSSKLDRFVLRLAESGIPTVEQDIQQAQYTYSDKGIQSGSDTEHNVYVKLDKLIGLSQATLVLEGREVLFIEFGAGVHYNGEVGSSPHPKGQENSFLIGTYGMGNGSKQIWGYYADNGDLVLTRGTKATMPMYNASQEIINNVVRIAKEVFN